VAVEVVDHGVDDLSFGNVDIEWVQEGGEDRRWTVGGDEAQYLSGVDLETGREVDGAVLEAVGFPLDELSEVA
jgi:hypothetical protein